MKYSDYIATTLSNQNGICWNYYRNSIKTACNLDSTNAKHFIQKYFELGGKNLPLLLKPTESTRFNDHYFIDGHKKLVLSFQYDAQHQLPQERATHTVSGFFLGLLLENCLSGLKALSVNSQNDFPFSYLWFLTYLYHDYGYCIAERQDLPNPFPTHAPRPNYSEVDVSRISRSEYCALSQIKRVLGINLSPFSQYPSYTYSGRCDHNIPPYSDRGILYKLTHRNNRITGSPKLSFNNGAIIRGHQYTSKTITRYINYCINERSRVDHGIIGGLLFYDKIVKNYMLAYKAYAEECGNVPGLYDFYYGGLHFCAEQLKIFSYVSDCILSHNVWKQPADKRIEYEQYCLTPLLEENFRIITYDENPLLYILSVADTLEPVKAYIPQDRSACTQEIQNIIEAIDIEYASTPRSLIFSSKSSDIDILVLYRKAESLREWTSVSCSLLNNNRFRLIL